MTKYDEYKNRIYDIKYIFLSNEIDIIDYQYILTLIHESIYVISEDLIHDLKKVLTEISFNEIKNPSNDIMSVETYQSLLWKIKRDINNYNIILDSTKNEMISILTQLNDVMMQEDNKVIEVNEKTVENECIADCAKCTSNCSITSSFTAPITNNPKAEEKKEDLIVEKVSNAVIDEIINNSKKLNSKYFNRQYLREYLLHNNTLKNECAVCGLTEWQNAYLQLQLDYLDGNSLNQELSNIRLLCPNCFSQIGHDVK